MSETTFIVNGEDIFAKIERLQAENERLKKALEKIRGIANKAINSNDCYERMYAGRMYCKPILTKINEVLDE